MTLETDVRSKSLRRIAIIGAIVAMAATVGYVAYQSFRSVPSPTELCDHHEQIQPHYGLTHDQCIQYYETVQKTLSRSTYGEMVRCEMAASTGPDWGACGKELSP